MCRSRPDDEEIRGEGQARFTPSAEVGRGDLVKLELAEIKTGRRRVVEYLLSPLRQPVGSSLQER